MSTENPGVVGGSSIHPYDCENAKEYAIESLREGDEPVKAADLAGEYECSPGHMRDVLREASEVERVSRGLYALSTETEASEPDTGIERPSADGPLLSPDTDGTVGDRETGETEAVECPVEGCDYEGDDLLALRGHANSMMNHNWEDVEDELEEEDMETEEAIEAQRERAIDDDQDDGVDDEQSEEVDKDVAETTEKGIPLPVSTTTLFVGVVVGIGALWLFTRYSSGGTQNQQNQQEQQEDVFSNARGLI